MKKTRSIAWWKKKAKTSFQLYVRVRDSNRFGICKCITCGSLCHYKKMDGGHFIRSNHSMACFDERNVHAQCKGCNKWRSGAWEEYGLFITKTYGEKILAELISMTGKIELRTADDYQLMIKQWNDKTKQLKKEKGFE